MKQSLKKKVPLTELKKRNRKPVKSFPCDRLSLTDKANSSLDFNQAVIHYVDFLMRFKFSFLTKKKSKYFQALMAAHYPAYVPTYGAGTGIYHQPMVAYSLMYLPTGNVQN